MKDIIIGNRKIGKDQAPFIIAELSGNHNQSLERALQLVEEAARAGAHAVKLQTYTADTITLDVHENEFFINDNKSLWKGESLYNLYKKAHTPWEWHEQIFNKCKSLGLICFSTPFDETAVDFLNGLEVPCFKIASFENVHLPLVRKAAKTGKPLIVSTGMASIAELGELVETIRGAGCENFVLLKCTSTYPATPENTNLVTIPHMRELFRCEVGLSDHTMGVGVAVAAVALGASVIEKHFTLRRSDGGVDSAFSMEPEEMRLLVSESERAWRAIGRISYGPTDAETKSLQYRRSLYFSRDVKKGESLSPDSVRAVRPGLGLPPKYLEIILGKKVNRDVKKGTPLSWELIG